MNRLYVHVWGVICIGMLFFNMIIFSIERDHENIFRWVGVIVMLGGIGKNF